MEYDTISPGGGNNRVFKDEVDEIWYTVGKGKEL
jgi:hypothetical protein